MKQLASNYSISGSTVTLTGVNVPLSQILLVSDATSGNVLYSMAGPAASSYTQAANSAITLASAPGASDKLTIYYDDGVAPANAPSSVSVSNFPTTQAVSLASVPSHAVTNAGTFAVQNTAAVIGGNTTAVKVDGSAATQPISGTVTANVQGGNATAVKVDGSAVTQPVSLASVPSHAVTNAGTFAVQPSAGDLTSGSQTTKIVNGSNTLAIDSTGAATVNNAAQAQYNYTNTGTLSGGTVLIGPITVGSLRSWNIYISSIGSGGSLAAQLSFDGTNWFNSNETSIIYGGGWYSVSLCGASQARLVVVNAVSSGTTTIYSGVSQQFGKTVNAVSGYVNLNGGTNTVGAVLTPAGSITMTNNSVGTTSATLLAASSASKMLVVQNTHATNSLYVSTTTPATATNGILIPATWGYEFPYIPTNALYVLGAGASTTYTLWYA